MSARLWQCRQGLAAALDHALDAIITLPPESASCSGQFPTHQAVEHISQTESLPKSPHCFSSPSQQCRNPSSPHSFSCKCLVLSSVHDGPHSTYAPKPETFSNTSDVLLTQDLLEIIESVGMQTLEELVGKLEFENESNRVHSSLSQDGELSSSPLLWGDQAISSLEHSRQGDTPRVQEHDSMLEAVLEMEQEYDISVDYNSFCAELLPACGVSAMALRETGPP